MTQAASAVDNERLLRRETVVTDALFNDFNLPPLDEQVTKGCPITGMESLGNDSSSPDHVSHLNAPRYPHEWSPLFLTQNCLLAFIALLLSLFIVLAVLFGYSQSHKGLSAADEHLYYIWTYGPTAVLSAASALWFQVVYRTKQLMPWKAMASGPQTASKSVLLDYVSPPGPVALYRAVSNSHHTVGLSIFSTFIMLGLTVASTGLFNVQRVDLTADDVSLITTNHFDFENFDWASTDSRPAGLVYATTVHGLQYPSGTTAQFAVQDFSALHGSNKTLIASVDAFSAYLDCEPATLSVTNVTAYSPFGTLFHSGGTITANITSSDCTITGFQINSPTILDHLQPFNETVIVGWGYGQLGTCVEHSSVRVVVSAGTYSIDERWNGTEFDNFVNLVLPYDKTFRIINSTNILCKPNYTVGTARVVKHLNSTSNSQLRSIEPLGRTKPPTHESQAVEIARSVFQSVDDPLTRSYYMNDSTLSYDTFFNIMLQMGPNPGYSGAANLFWHQFTTCNGQVVQDSPRLFVRVLSFAILETGLVMLLGISTYLLTSVLVMEVSRDPGSINGLAIILSKSPELIELVNGKESFHKSFFDVALQDHVYSTRHPRGIANSCETKVFVKGKERTKKAPSTIQTRQFLETFWEPLVLRVPTRIMIVLITVIYVVVLEVLLIISQSRDGIVSIDTNSWLHYRWTYVPALSMVFIGSAYDSANTSIKMVNPYAEMHRRSVPADVSIQDHPLSRTTLHELFASGKQRQIAIFFATLATLLASLLPIAVSGLYTPVNHGQDIKIHQLTAWNFNDAKYPNFALVNDTFVGANQSYPGDLDTSSSLRLVTSLIVTANLSYPAWSYDELAFPLLNASTIDRDAARRSEPLGGSVEVKIPTVRGALNCSVVPHDYVDIHYPNNYSFYQSSAVQMGNHQCLNYTWAGTEWLSNPDEDCHLALFSIRHGLSLGGCSIDQVLMSLPRHGPDSQAFGYFSQIQTLTNHTYCPMYVGMVGTTTKTSIEDYTSFGCSSEAERVDARATFALPEYTILTASADETTVERLVGNASDMLYDDDGGANVVTFTRPNSALSNAEYQPNNYLNFYNMTEGQNFDNFFSCLVYGRDGVPPSTMIGEDNIPRLFAAVQHLWRVVLAQQLRTSSSWMSAEPSDLKAWAPQGSWNGMLRDPNAYRLKQSVLSTRILQVLLSAMVACGSVAFVALGPTRRLLPNNPSRIAIAASLLAGSELLRVVEKAERIQDEKTGNKGQEANRWGGYLFSLGWWDRGDGERRFGVDIGRADLAQ